LEREIDQTRANMDRTLGALERKLSPGQLLDEAMGLAREHGGEFASNLGRSLKENPMPALLTAVGVVWMLASSNRPRSSRAYDYRRDDYIDEYNDGLDQTEFRSADLPTSGTESSSWSQTAERAKSSAQGAVSGVGQRAKAAADTVGEKLSSSREAVRARFSRTSESAAAQGQRLREGVQNLFEEQPLVIGALGVALGAAIGAALPRTEQEDRLFGEIRDNAVSAIKDRGSQAYEQVRETVDRVGQRVGEEVNQKKSELGGESSGSRSTSESNWGVNEEHKPA
jgi:hypothetical protein